MTWGINKGPIYPEYLSFYLDKQDHKELCYFSKLDKIQKSDFMRRALHTYLKKYKKLYGPIPKTDEELKKEHNIKNMKPVEEINFVTDMEGD